MTNRVTQVLLVEDSPGDAELTLLRLLEANSHVQVKRVDRLSLALEWLAVNQTSLILLDLNLPDSRGGATYRSVLEKAPGIAVVILSGQDDEGLAAEALHLGAQDYLVKGSINAKDLDRAMRYAIERQTLLRTLASSNAELEQFAYVASHDLQEPLRMVANYTQLLAERYRGQLDEQADKYIHYAIDGSTRMQAMIQDLLSFSRAGRYENNVHNTDSKELVEQAIRNLQATILESGAVVKIDALPTVIANSIQITQLFQNLIGNAIKFHGTETPTVHISAEEKDGELIFSVADNGIGIAVEHANVIFSIFQRLHTRTEYPGNGIGLAICKKIIERHGGRIWLDSEPGHGCVFKFTLPAGAAVKKGSAVEEVTETGKRDAAHV